jgi:N-acetylneuraminic acid mutarotase
MGKSVALLLVLIFVVASSITFAKPALSSPAAITENSWVSKAPMHEARAYLGVAVVNGKIYAIGGDTSIIMGNVVPGTGKSYLLLKTNEEYNPENNTWTTKAPMPTARALFGTAVFQNKIYCIGGYTTNVVPYEASYGPQLNITYHDSAVNEVYDPATDSWEIKTSLPVPICYAQATTIGNKIYVTAYLSSSVYIYDPSTDSWSTGNSAPFEIRSVGFAYIANKIYTVGQDWSQYHYPTNTIVKNYIQAYDTQNNSWSILGNSSTIDSTANGAGATSGIIAPERVYFFDQSWNSSGIYAVTKIYDPATNSWADGAPMPSNRLCAGIVVLNDSFYVIGGRFGQWGYITMEYPSAVTEQYLPVGYGDIRPVVSIISPISQVYNDSSVSLTFTVDKPASLMEYSLDGLDNVTITGNTTLAGLSDGVHNVTVYAKADNGNVGASETITFTVNNKQEPFPTTVVAAVSGAFVAVVGFGLFWYLRKRNHNQ